MTPQNEISSYRELQNRIDLASSILISTHISPDGDALGSELALYRYLKKSGKIVNIINHSPTPDVFEFLDPEKLIMKYNDKQHKYLFKSADLFICVDVGDVKRLGDQICGQLTESRISTINIDHHPGNGSFDFIQDLVQTYACSTGSILYKFMDAMHPEYIDRETAEALYIALMTDTGNFRYNNTGSASHRIAAGLLEHDIDPAAMYRAVYEQNSPARMRLLADILSQVNYSCEGSFVWFAVSADAMKKSGADHDDTEGFSDLMRSIKGVEVSMMIKEKDDGTARVNFRSKGNIEMLTVARRLNGGGHAYACGANVDLPFKVAVDDLPQMVEKYIKERSK